MLRLVVLLWKYWFSRNIRFKLMVKYKLLKWDIDWLAATAFYKRCPCVLSIQLLHCGIRYGLEGLTGDIQQLHLDLLQKRKRSYVRLYIYFSLDTFTDCFVNFGAILAIIWCAHNSSGQKMMRGSLGYLRKY